MVQIYKMIEFEALLTLLTGRGGPSLSVVLFILNIVKHRFHVWWRHLNGNGGETKGLGGQQDDILL